MSAIFGVAVPGLPSDASPLLSAVSEEAEGASSFCSAGNAGFRALAPARTAVSNDGKNAVALTGRITNRFRLCRQYGLPETDDVSLLLALSGMESAPWGELEGNYAFALWNGSRKRLILVSDGIGSLPLCWCRWRGGFAFASRPGMLAGLPDLPLEYDVEALRYYLSMQYLPVGRSVYSGIRKVLPGSVLTFDLEAGTMQEQPLKHPVSGGQPEELSFSDAAVFLRKMLTDSVERALRCVPDDGPAGVLLSGGIDSAIVAGLAAKLAGPRGIRAFTIGTGDPRYDERDAARMAVREIRHRGGVVEHHEFTFGPEDLERLRKRVLLWGEPYADSSLLATAKLRDETSQYAGLLLGGDGGDELFCGYDRYRALRLSGMLDGWGGWLRPLFRAGARLLSDGGDRSLSGRLRRFGIFLGEGRARCYFALLDRCPEPLAGTLLGERFRDVRDAFSFLKAESTGGIPSCPVERAARWDQSNYLPGDTCIKAAIAGMGTGAFLLMPLLDGAILRFARSLPLEYKLTGRGGKRLLKAAFSDLIPAELLHAPKRGFGVPVADYLRGPWRETARSALFDSPLVSGGWLQRKGLEQLWREHNSGTRDHSYLLWGAVNLAWFLEGEKQR